MDSTKNPSDGYSRPVKVNELDEARARIASRTVPPVGRNTRYDIPGTENTTFGVGVADWVAMDVCGATFFSAGVAPVGTEGVGCVAAPVVFGVEGAGSGVVDVRNARSVKYEPAPRTAMTTTSTMYVLRIDWSMLQCAHCDTILFP